MWKDIDNEYMEDDMDEANFTKQAWESLYDAVDNTGFEERDASLIYETLKKRLKFIPFGEYLKRYIYKKAGIQVPYNEVDLKEYQLIIRDSFSENGTPPSFEPTTAKLSALAKNWLTQQTVKRNVVFLLGFGLSMSEEDVNGFLTKALREQGINAKNPFEVICRYCYKRGYGFHKFEKLWQAYCEAAPQACSSQELEDEYTRRIRSAAYAVAEDGELIAFLSRLKAGNNLSRQSVTARKYFMNLYDEARDLVAGLYNESGDGKKRYGRNDITESDLEHIISSAIPVDRHGNLTPGKASKLNAQFDGKRFNRQHIGNILAGKAEVNRFDLITLNFFVYSQKEEFFSKAIKRYDSFLASMNEILEDCSLSPIYVANPYECFILMCLLSEDPLVTYADVWELSYGEKQP